ncbi:MULTISPECIES: glycine betaine uptake BCCT transporter [unclassified Candidatus Frackibacter]|uniref:glycine betaine uptake BCCT transporter n=1 Tax=unclassified Candidatus Frackibacter TaxID=2648818 RepID=UPI0007945CA6|nr:MULTISPECIES: BCCT family transporter [unclassified Candidatus Frackibacter]KXS40277.1 MAG: choline/carnitine/betaine transporter [Candidatus Frackibacter sp. T328-2]SDC37146.1 BCCT, betaine/carnitine/choline family transporter [Candidatus Frackibacter sp. WG11]SEM62859.1 BCCT, betaine/carnitine/choline family transporter [Candidatus Frackibacter sp. WG12]SFL64881.1 BCCT, betaine/carnitine/choline family transporter [Candidatus Frackibacter sp. WG13]
MPGTEKETNVSSQMIKIDSAVFWPSAIISGILIIWGIVANESFGKAVNGVFDFLVGKFGWLYLIFVSAVLVVTLVVGLSKYGEIKLGKPDEEPEFSKRSWFAMLFSAGMGIGLVFWGVAEPIYHYASPPFGEGQTAESALLAIRYAFFHWGLHPWALYSLFGMMIAYFGFRRGMPQLPSSTLYPLVGKKGVKGLTGKVFDILAVFATLFGIATSLGLGAQQINSGLNVLFGIPNNNVTAVILIGIVTGAFILSAVTGLDKGIKILSNINISLGSLLLLLMIIVGPTIFIFDLLAQGIGGYFQNIFDMSFFTSPVKQNPWPGWWTIFYWAWWIAWTPFVGGFIARISRGRTIKEFVIGTLFLPTIVSFLWLAVMGGSAIWLEQFGAGGIVGPVKADIASAFFVTLGKFPLGSIMSLIATILIGTFFITSADSGTFVMGMLTSHGTLNPSTKVKVTWGVAEGLVAAILLLAGGLSALQTASIAGAFPFMLFMIFSIFAFFKALRNDYEFLEKGEFIGSVDL